MATDDPPNLHLIRSRVLIESTQGPFVVTGATQFDYRAAFVPAGTYAVAFTCGDDDPTSDDALTFSPAQNATVQPNLITTIDFAAAPAGG